MPAAGRARFVAVFRWPSVVVGLFIFVSDVDDRRAWWHRGLRDQLDATSAEGARAFSWGVGGMVVPGPLVRPRTRAGVRVLRFT